MLLSSLRDSSIIDSLMQSAASLLSFMVDVVRARSQQPPLAYADCECAVSSLSHQPCVRGRGRRSVAVSSAVCPPAPLLLSSGCLSRIVATQFDAAYSFLSLWWGEQEMQDAALRMLDPLISQHRSPFHRRLHCGYAGLCQLLHSAALPPPPPLPHPPLQRSPLWTALSGTTQSLLVSVLSRSCDDKPRVEPAVVSPSSSPVVRDAVCSYGCW